LGPREPLSSLIDEFRYNLKFADKVRHLEQRGYVGWRRVLGDGNCYYRSVAFGLLEQIAALPSCPERRRFAAGLLQSLAPPSEKEEEVHYHHLLLQRIQRLAAGASWEEPPRNGRDLTGLGLLYQSLHDPKSHAGLDLALVRSLRRTAANYILQRQHEETAPGSGISFADVCMCSDYASVQDFCDRVVLPLGRDAETLCQQALPAALGIRVRIAFLDRESAQEANYQDFGCAATQPTQEEGQSGGWAPPTVHVQLRPGHYDLLYFNQAKCPFGEDVGPQTPRGQANTGPRFPTLGAEDHSEYELMKPPP